MKRLKVGSSIFLILLMVFGSISAAPHAETQALSSPKNLQIPSLAFDEDSITLVWEKPENYGDIVDFNCHIEQVYTLKP
ncbi:hypothetical protein PH210_25155 [Paenibacillus sp. BSR1-1]|uniref:hypothetical protein n=1 Tax=Paenibacillus sp. BSR1-1 TaxID=3020845 RepID=UPI0025B14887|nr:hypothetical protein [Paenibacillus sp. BSR1-1]MDN3019460.1 hypothetical protein [Paenibacillus sp. BSR1-1]